MRKMYSLVFNSEEDTCAPQPIMNPHKHKKHLLNKVADLCRNVQAEDKGVDFVAVYNTDGVRMSGGTPIEHLLQLGAFTLRVNDSLYAAQLPDPVLNELPSETIRQTDDLKTLVATLYSTLNVDEHQLKMEKALLAELETVKQELQPLEQLRDELLAKSHRRSGQLAWLGLAAMGVQMGAFARLTWWEYSWDIMEPVTYFATYSTLVGGFAYFVLTRQSYEYHEARDRVYLKVFHNSARKVQFDVNKYNQLRVRLHELQHDLKRIRDPLYLHLPLSRLQRGDRM